MTERARPESVRSLFQRTVSRFSDNAINKQPAVLLERTDRMVELAVEHIDGNVLTGDEVFVGVLGKPQRRQGCPNLGDRTPTITATQTRHTRPFPAVLRAVGGQRTRR